MDYNQMNHLRPSHIGFLLGRRLRTEFGDFPIYFGLVKLRQDRLLALVGSLLDVTAHLYSETLS